MKKIALILNFTVALALVFTSCKKDDNGDTFSPLGVEQDKQAIEQTGLSLIEDVRGLSETPFANAGASMSKRMNSTSTSPQQKLVLAIAGIGEAMKNQESLDAQFAGLKSLAIDNNGYFTSVWSDSVGIYEYDFAKEDFVKTSSGGDEIVLKFPSSEESAVNDAQLRLYNFEVFTGDFPGKGEEDENGDIVDEMISNLNFELKIGDELAATSNISIDFASTGEVEKMGMTFNPIPYGFETSLGNANNSANARFTFTKDQNIIFEHKVYGTYQGEGEDIMPKTAGTSLQVKEIKMIAETNIDAIMEDAMNYNGGEMTNEEAMQVMVDMVNKHSKLSIRYASNNNVIAKGKVILVTDVDMYGYESYDFELVFEFSDGSLVSMETYMEESMQTFEAEMEKLMADLEAKWN